MLLNYSEFILLTIFAEFCQDAVQAVAANCNLITAAIPGHSGSSPVPLKTHSRKLIHFLASNFERTPAAALRDYRLCDSLP